MHAYLEYLQKDLDRSGLFQQLDDVMSSVSVNLKCSANQNNQQRLLCDKSYVDVIVAVVE